MTPLLDANERIAVETNERIVKLEISSIAFYEDSLVKQNQSIGNNN